MSLELKIITGDGPALRRLVQAPLVLGDSTPDACTIRLGDDEIVPVPGAFGGWYELAVTLGIIGLPISVLAGCLADWLMGYLRDRGGQGDQADEPPGAVATSAVDARLILRNADRTAELTLVGLNRAALADALATALAHVDPER